MMRSLLAIACLIGTLVPVKPIPVQSPNTQTPALTVTIATTGTFLGTPSTKFKVGDQIPVSITMTNDAPVLATACISSNLYQNVPRLTKEGKVIPYINWQAYEQKSAERNQVCQRENLPQSIAIGPRESKLTDWFVLADSTIATGAEAWYEQLTPGKYELSIQRRINCCDGPMIESNKISFEVTP
ncbi:MAG TPA: hypothetical protein VLB68_28455 [Pyrinomonadaceae bacterium]|nr:hypothetical protein [Pyrinomonadaceae bacterium]